MRSLVRPATASATVNARGWPRHPQAAPGVLPDVPVPPRSFEYTYYGFLIYIAFGSALGLHLRFFAPALLAFLALLCLAHPGSKRLAVFAPIALPFACGLSFLAIQLVWHAESLFPRGNADGPGGDLGFHVAWLMGLIVVQSLSLRSGFLHRFALVSFAYGVGLLPYLKFYPYTDTIVRLGLQGVGRDNPNHLGMWGGFCAVYFFVLGIETQRTLVRAASWCIGVGCLYIVALTVSRGPLFAAVFAIAIAFRRLLKRGFVPVLLLLGIGWISYTSGLFDQVASFYLDRGLEESGRGLTLPVAIDRILRAPLVGSGVSSLLLYTPGAVTAATPHNGILHLAIAAGIFPAILFVAYWWQAALGVLRTLRQRLPDAPYLLPLLVFAFLEMMIIDYAFMSEWHMVVLSASVAAYASRQTSLADGPAARAPGGL